MYRVGFPGWKMAARWGVPLVFDVQVHRDDDSGTYWAESSDLDGLVVSGTDLDDLQSEILSAARALLSLSVKEVQPNAKANIVIHSPLPAVA